MTPTETARHAARAIRNLIAFSLPAAQGCRIGLDAGRHGGQPDLLRRWQLGPGNVTMQAGEIAASLTTLSSQDGLPPDVPATLLAQPTFHVAPVLLPEPGDHDVADPGTSAAMQPSLKAVDAGLAALSTKGLTLGKLEAAHLKAQAADGGATAAPLATGAVATYTPAQVRAAYGLPALPATGATPTAQQWAQMGAGQTIYIVAAYHNPNAAAELATFNQKFGLPACAAKVLPATTALPLAAPAANAGCELWVAYANTSGGLSAAAPAYDSGWATEIALDVQWSHAIAPAARIVLIEAPDASVGTLSAAIRLANAMGPGHVSMSFGAGEGNWASGLESAFTGTRMSYLAATGDSGAGVMWPAASPGVLAVGGTSLTYSGTGSRSEVAWSGTGGGTSAYFGTPAYQQSGLPGVGAVARWRGGAPHGGRRGDERRPVHRPVRGRDPARRQHGAVAERGRHQHVHADVVGPAGLGRRAARPGGPGDYGPAACGAYGDGGGTRAPGRAGRQHRRHGGQGPDLQRRGAFGEPAALCAERRARRHGDRHGRHGELGQPGAGHLHGDRGGHRHQDQSGGPWHVYGAHRGGGQHRLVQRTLDHGGAVDGQARAGALGHHRDRRAERLVAVGHALRRAAGHGLLHAGDHHHGDLALAGGRQLCADRGGARFAGPHGADHGARHHPLTLAPKPSAAAPGVPDSKSAPPGAGVSGAAGPPPDRTSAPGAHQHDAPIWRVSCSQCRS